MNHAPRMLAGAVLAGTFGLAGIAVSAQTAFSPSLAARPMPAMSMAPPASDAQYATAASASNNAEIAQARLALRRSRNPQVRAFAQRMIDDHTTASVQLQAATRSMGSGAPVSGVTPAQSAELTGLMRSNDFDAEYMIAQVPEHQNAIAATSWEINHGRDSGLRDYASRELPIIQQHLRLAQTFVSTNGMSLGLSPDGSNAVINPPGRGPNNGASGTQVDNNPATGSNGTTQGQNSPSNPTQPQAAPAATPGYPIGGSGTPPPIFGSPAPGPTRAPKI